MLETLLSSTILIILILLIRKIFCKHLSSKYLYSLWIIPAVRLLILPIIELPEGWSLISLLIRDPRKFNLFGLYTNEAEGLKVIVDIGMFFKSWIAILVWVVGMFTVFLIHMIPYIRTKTKLKRNRSFIERYQNDRLNIYSSDLVNSPMLYGFDIYIPTGMVDEKRNYALAVMHERCHFQQWDELWNLMRVISSCIYWFNPFVWLAVVRSRDDSEYSCDEAVVKNMDVQQKKNYCRLLIDVATGGGFDNNSFIEARLTRSPVFKRVELVLMEKKKMIRLKIITFLCLLMVMALTLNTAG